MHWHFVVHAMCQITYLEDVTDVPAFVDLNLRCSALGSNHSVEYHQHNISHGMGTLIYLRDGFNRDVDYTAATVFGIAAWASASSCACVNFRLLSLTAFFGPKYEVSANCAPSIAHSREGGCIVFFLSMCTHFPLEERAILRAYSAITPQWIQNSIKIETL